MYASGSDPSASLYTYLGMAFDPSRDLPPTQRAVQDAYHKQVDRLLRKRGSDLRNRDGSGNGLSDDLVLSGKVYETIRVGRMKRLYDNGLREKKWSHTCGRMEDVE